jgi:hypothetical protein
LIFFPGENKIITKSNWLICSLELPRRLYVSGHWQVPWTQRRTTYKNFSDVGSKSVLHCLTCSCWSFFTSSAVTKKKIFFSFHC